MEKDTKIEGELISFELKRQEYGDISLIVKKESGELETAQLRVGGIFAQKYIDEILSRCRRISLFGYKKDFLCDGYYTKLRILDDLS